MCEFGEGLRGYWCVAATKQLLYSLFSSLRFSDDSKPRSRHVGSDWCLEVLDLLARELQSQVASKCISLKFVVPAFLVRKMWLVCDLTLSDYRSY